LLSNVAAIDGAGSAEGRVFYSNFARFRQTRIQGIAERLLRDDAMRQALFPRSDTDLALALAAIGERAQQEGWQFDGFEGWSGTAVEEFIRDHPPHDGAGD